RLLAPRPEGPMLIVGAGVQARVHLQAFAAVLGVREFFIASRSRTSAQALVEHARSLGLRANEARDANAALALCPLVATCTPAHDIVLRALPRADAFIAAVGAFTPQMAELSPEFCRHIAAHGRIVVDTRDAEHEAGDLLQAQIPIAPLPSLQDVVRTDPARTAGPVLFKSCGWAGWDLAAARLALRQRG
ncbi:MAG: delta(1)-pyrroline-2-carboxylate reductase family protein, partial [Comamonas sp.]